MKVNRILLLCAFGIFSAFALHDGEQIHATIEFNQQGVVGQIVFTELENGSVQISTTFLPGNFSSWHVHPFPVDFTADPATRCSSAFLGGHFDPSERLKTAGANYSTVCNASNPASDPLDCEAGDLAGKFGDLTEGNLSFVDNDPELQLRGRYSIIGRSVVIHPPGHGHLACANIHLDEDDDPGLYVAEFMGPTVGGSIYFRQSRLEPEVGVFIYAKLFYTSTRETTMDHVWGIYNGTPSSVLDYSRDNCTDIGSLYNPTNATADDPNCSPSNTSACRVGDLSTKLGDVDINGSPVGGMAFAWTDDNLYYYPYVRQTVAIRAVQGDQIIACAQILPVAQIMSRAYRPAQSSMFTLRQRSPFDPTYIKLPVGLLAGAYQINPDGNIRGDDTCYSTMVFEPFVPNLSVNTSDSFAVGNLSGKHNFVADSMIEDIILPLSNRASALGHNFMFTPMNGDPSCGTIDLPMASGDVRVIRANVSLNTSSNVSSFLGSIYLRQVVTSSNNTYVSWPTVINWLLQYMTTGMNRTEGHRWAVRMRSCEESTGQTYNPYGVTDETAVCNETTGSRYHKRCAVGDLSGKNGLVAIRAEASLQRTLVATDSNLPLYGPYTVLGRSIVLYSSSDNSVMGCGNILPENLSSMRVMLSFPVTSGVDHRINLPTAIVHLLYADDVTDGEVIILYMADTDDCTTVTLGFTQFEGGNASSIAMRVKQLYQDDLPGMYQRGSCPIGNLQQRSSVAPTPTTTPTAAGFISNPCVLLTNFMLLLSIFILLN